MKWKYKTKNSYDLRDFADTDKSVLAMLEGKREFGKYELEIERYYDHCLVCRVLEHITRRPQGIIID